ncbi:MAG TPA: SDR family oxidoreductase [Gemmatimonadaceae bacterium]|nr:SDR family oxidoreductase [Gemmatimonadaceae bacterium]
MKRKSSSGTKRSVSGARSASGARSTNGRAGSREVARERRRPKPPMPRQSQPAPGLEREMTPRPQFQAPVYRAAGKLEGKVALITGGDSGIGRAVAVLFAREGADVAIIYTPAEEPDAAETRHYIEREGRRALLLAGDVTQSSFCREAVDQVVRELGRLDVLVNNAAYQSNVDSIDELTEDQWDRTFRTNIYGYFHMAKAALAHMKRGACIINTGSITGLEGSKDLLDYSATKGAIHAFTKSLAQNLVEKRIRVNCVAPGPVWTPLNVTAKDASDVPEFGADTPMGRPGQPEEIAPAYVFFASNADSSFITGEVLTLLGGDTRAG